MLWTSGYWRPSHRYFDVLLNYENIADTMRLRVTEYTKCALVGSIHCQSPNEDTCSWSVWIARIEACFVRRSHQSNFKAYYSAFTSDAGLWAQAVIKERERHPDCHILYFDDHDIRVWSKERMQLHCKLREEEGQEKRRKVYEVREWNLDCWLGSKFDSCAKWLWTK